MKKYDGHQNLNNADPSLCIASKIMKAHRIVNGIFRKHLKTHGISNSQMSILFYLAKRGKVKQQEIADVLFLEKSSLSRNMARLYDQDYVSKEKFPLVEITPHGLLLMETIVPVWTAAMDEAKNRLKQDGIEGLNAVIKNLTQNL